MKTNGKLLAALLALLLVLSLAGCAGGEEGQSSAAASAAKTTVRVMGLKGPTGMGMAKLMADQTAGTTKNDYRFTLAGAPDEVSAEVIKGSVDIAAVPTNLAAVLYQKTGGKIQVAALNTLGVLYLLEKGNTIQSVADLKGKTIVATGKASTPEYILRYLLTQNGIDPEKDVTIEYKSEHSELATLMTAGTVTLGMLPEPNVTAVLSANSEVRVALNLTEEWNKVAQGGSTLTQGCIIVQKDFAANQPAALAAFLEEYQASVNYVNQNIDDASQLIEQNGIIPKAAVAKKALPNCNICYVDGAQMKTQLSGFLKVLFDANPQSVGGAMPDDAFYYQK